MAGTVPSLALSTQFDKNGLLLAGGKLYFYQANTLIPQNAFADTGLSVALPNPITLDASGRVPEFYCADGNIRARLVDASGVVQLDAKNLLVVGPSSGGGGGGSSVDPATIFQTGDVIWLDQAGTRAGGVRDNARSIGSASSGASERANADCQPLFTFLWQTYADAVCPVVGGRGVSAAADWTANKQITLPDKRGFLPAGLDDMGSSTAGRFAGVPFSSGGATTAGASGGEATHTLSSVEIPAHTHNNTLTDPGHAHSFPIDPGIGASGGGDVAYRSNGGSTVSVNSATTGITLTNASVGGGGAHNNMPPIILGTFYRKL
ncbi:MAG TPA: hypothetical protein VFB45_10530 [Pseudolabrys sp.]|nr:hypothetical protein [Pseudolabrys sp.]